MPTERQSLGNFGEQAVAKHIRCPKCKKTERTFRLLPPSFTSSDLVCDFCGYFAQVKTIRQTNLDSLPEKLRGAAWKPQKERMDAGIFIPLFIVVFVSAKEFAIFLLPTDFQTPEMFEKRNPLKETAKRKGWVGYTIVLTKAISSPQRVY
jgi:hypothetical protein